MVFLYSNLKRKLGAGRKKWKLKQGIRGEKGKGKENGPEVEKFRRINRRGRKKNKRSSEVLMAVRDKLTFFTV